MGDYQVSGRGKTQTYFLKDWMQTRGPLFERARMAAIRAVVLTEVLILSRAAPERGVRIRAARTMGAHGGGERPSKRPAGEEQYEAARELCSGLRRISREAAHLPFTQQSDRVIALLREYEPEGRGAYDYLMDNAWAELLCGVLFAREDTVRLRAARTLLCWTEPDACKVGRELDEEEKQTLDEVRDEAAARQRLQTHWGPAVQCAPGNAPEIQARGRDGP
ncbi:MAG: hypothetical protein KDH09_16980 [Chrysiogenetes bacterium]|nr:hypothetical protein [Chrysiogenetes bacterium]